MARDITNITAIEDDIFWELLTNIILWLSKTMKTSVQMILNPLREDTWNYLSDTDSTELRNGFQYLNLLLKEFPSFLASRYNQVLDFILKGVQNNDESVRKAALECLKTIVNDKEDSQCFGLISLCAQFMLILVGENYKLYNYILDASGLVLKYQKNLAGCFTFNALPLNFFQSKENDVQVAAMKVFPFALHTTPLLFTESIVCSLLSQYCILANKKSQCRSDTLESLANFIFYKKGVFTEKETTELLKIRPYVVEAIDLKQGVYAYIAFLSLAKEKYAEDSPVIYTKTLTKLMITGFLKYLEIIPDNINDVHSHILGMICKVLFTQNQKPEQIILAFESLLELNISISYFNTELVVFFCSFLSNPDLAVRQKASEFIVSYQRQVENFEITHLLLLFVSTETDKKLRIKTFRGMKKYFENTGIVSVLHILLHDTNYKIKKEALYSFANLADNKKVASILTTYLNEQIPGKYAQDIIGKERIALFLIVSLTPQSHHIIAPFAEYLISHLVQQTKLLPTSALQLLASILHYSPKSADLNMLVGHISDSILSHSSKNRIDSALKLLQAALESTDLRMTIYCEHSQLIMSLINISKLSETGVSRGLLVRILGSIGVVKPSVIHHLALKRESKMKNVSIRTASYFITNSESIDPTNALMFAAAGVAITNIIDILLDETLSVLHILAIECLLSILKNYRQVGSELESWLLGKINYLVANGAASTLTILFTNMPTLITVLGNRFAPLVPHVVDYICSKWNTFDKFLLIRITEWMYLYVKDAFIPYFHQIIDLFITNFDFHEDKIIDSIISAFVSFGDSIKMVDHLVYPCILNWILYNADQTMTVNEILIKLKAILVVCGTEKYSTHIVRTLCMAAPVNPALHSRLLDILTVVASQTGKPFLLYLPWIKNAIDITQNEMFSDIVHSLQTDTPLSAQIFQFVTPTAENRKSRGSTRTLLPNVGLNQDLINQIKSPRQSWDESQWMSWYQETFSTILRASTSRTVTICIPLTERTTKLKEALYPIAFVLVYIADIKNINNPMFTILENVCCSKTVPFEILRLFLSITELCEYLGFVLPLEKKIIAEAAERANLLEQSLRCYEDQFAVATSQITEKLVVLNQNLGLNLAANGVLRYAHNLGLDARQDVLAEKLGLWDAALELYNKRIENNPDDVESINRKLRCLQELSMFEELRELTEGTAATYEAVAAWELFDCEKFKEVVKQMKGDDDESLFYKSIYHVLIDDFDEAKKLINILWKNTSKKLFPTISVDYDRAVPEFAKASYLSVLEEIMLFKEMQSKLQNPIPECKKEPVELITRIKLVWKKRFEILPDIPTILHHCICLASMTLATEELSDEWLAFLNASIKTGRFAIAEDTISKFQKHNTIGNRLEIARLDLLWEEGKHDEAIKIGNDLLPKLESQPSLFQKVQCKVGEWLMKNQKYQEAHSHIESVIKMNPKVVSYWELWSRVTFALYEETDRNSYLTESLNASLTGLIISEENQLSFSLQIISILFRRGNSEIYQLFASKVSQIPVDVWLHVLPQIIARLTTSSPELQETIIDLIYSVALVHPQPVLYSLLVPFKSDTGERRTITKKLFDRIRIRFHSIVDEILSLADELIRVAVSWWERCQTQLDEASRSYFIYNNMEEMISHMCLIHDLILTKKPETFYEVSFFTQFSESLSIADQHLQKLMRSGDIRDLHQTWYYFASIFNKIKPIVTEMNVIPLEDASPYLSSLTNSQLAVPGSYINNSNSVVLISKIQENIKVIKSKQRPRKMVIHGTDGLKYKFLLKAHEDTRLDERVMQLFTFINLFVESSNIPMKNKLDIVTYRVIPLTQEVGLIGWVPDCTTLFNMVKLHRERNHIPIEAEFNMTKQFAPNFQELQLDGQVVAFNKGLTATDGNDLKELLFANSRNSSHWLDKRTMYATSLAMTSMAGYILGLGDRHLCNIMMDVNSGKLIHIDFGDCFEVAMHRDSFPERVPFRLTRIMVNALEVSKIEGTFRCCCENVMDVLRGNGEQILSLLETFIYDPLLQWMGEEDQVKSCSAITCMERIKDKLCGNDFPEPGQYSAKEQVNALINQATDPRNLCQMFKGWFPWW